jgi:tetratricopeptide (TPR) repeat protein/MFS family permease
MNQRIPVNSLTPYAAVFLSSFCIMVLELVAGRVIAKHLGSSIYTWTSVIGIVLAGIAAGNYLGGRIADRHQPMRALGALFLLASIVAATVPSASRFVAEWTTLWTLSWRWRVFLHVAALFLLPSLLLGTISPVAAKIALSAERPVGRTLGSVYAWGVVGSILGTFLAGFTLIPTFGTTRILWSVAVLLAAVPILFTMTSRFRWTWFSFAFFLGVIDSAPWAWAERLGTRLKIREANSPQIVCEVESLYSDIKVLSSSSQGLERRHLMIDKMIHNTFLVSDPTVLEDAYLRMFGVLSHVVRPEDDPVQALIIGGGAYIFPRYIESKWPGSTCDVVEIDPELTRVSHDVFGLAEASGLHTFHEDGRVFVNRLLRERGAGRPTVPYDLVYLDAFNDYSVPYQLTTLEQNRAIREMLSPTGAYMINVIESFQSGLLLGALLNTLEAAFSDVQIFFEGSVSTLNAHARDTFVVLASPAQFDFGGVLRSNPHDYGLHALSAGELAELRSRNGKALLTDDWAPTDNLLAPVVRASASKLASGALAGRGARAMDRGDLTAAEKLLERALALDPWNARAHRHLGALHGTKGDFERSRHHFEETLRLDPNQREVYVAMATETAKHGLMEDAARYLQRALEVDPDDLEIKNNLGILLAQRGDLASAANVFAEIVAEDPEYFAARKSLAAALYQLGRVEEAVQHLEEAERIEPGEASVRELLTRIRSGEFRSIRSRADRGGERSAAGDAE